MDKTPIGACLDDLGGSLKADKVGCEGCSIHALFCMPESNIGMAGQNLSAAISPDEDQKGGAALAGEKSIESFTELARECETQEIHDLQGVSCNQPMAPRPPLACLYGVAQTSPIGLCCHESNCEASESHGP
jgi:hypothetical protein